MNNISKKDNNRKTESIKSVPIYKFKEIILLYMIENICL